MSSFYIKGGDCSMERVKIKLIIIAVILLGVQGVSAVLINADSCIQQDVQAAINQAVDGDSVRIPFGSCTWTTPVNIIDKNVAIIGAGQGLTNISYDGPDAYDSAAFHVDNDAEPKDGFEISHLTIINGMGDSASGAALIMVWDAGPDWRIHHCTFSSGYAGNMIYIGRYTGSNGGLIDHCTFDKKGSGHIKAFQISAKDVDVESYDSATTPYGHTSWNRPISLGTRNALYIEDCNFIWEDDYSFLDVDEGGRVVFRHNDIIGAGFGTHGHDGGSRDTGVFSYEIYGNSFDAGGTGRYNAIGLRGGTGVIYDNTFSGNYGATTNLYHYCACDPQVTCNGGWPTPCTYPCEGQIGRTAGNTLEPLYFWDNVYNDGLSGPSVFDGGGLCDEIHSIIQEDRDYYNDIQKSDYSPFVYPHPLSLPICGDHIMEGEEECDDGNNADGDGCDSSCQTEGAGNFHYVRAGATGNNDGSDWANAWDSLPEVLERGHTYFIADGEYSGYVFDDPEQGDEYIYIKKATVDDHGTDVGWLSGYGDGYVEFTGTLYLNSGYLEIDGQEGFFKGEDEPYGFRINCNSNNGFSVPDEMSFGHIKIKHVYLWRTHQDTNPGPRAFDFTNSGGTISDILIQHVYIHRLTTPFYFGVPAEAPEPFIRDVVVEYSTVELMHSSAAVHSETASIRNSANITFRYNWFQDQEGTGGLNPMSGNCPDFFIYGNIWVDTGLPTCQGYSHGVMSDRDSTTGGLTENLHFIHNTIASLSGRAGLIFQRADSSDGNVAYNNLWYDSVVTNEGLSDWSNNYYNNVNCINGQFLSTNSHLVNEQGNPCNCPSSTCPTDADYQIVGNNPFTDLNNLDLSLVASTESGYMISSQQGHTLNLDCTDKLVWNDVKPNEIIVCIGGTITISNIGEPDSLLDWEIVEYPDWGVWEFPIRSGEDLAVDGNILLGFELTAPDVESYEFNGHIKIINTENLSDVEYIEVSLTTPKNKVVNPFVLFFWRIIERFPFFEFLLG